MLDRKLYKTKICILFQRGHCPRQSCSFAHGDAELRRFTGSFSGRRDYRGSDLREKLDRRHSPHQRYSPGRDARDRHSLHGYSPSRSPGKRSERRHRRRHHLDGQSEGSGSLKISDGADDRTKDGKLSSYDDKDVLEEQLRQAQLDIEMLDDHKCQLELCVEEKIQEADTLTSTNEELEIQLKKEQEDCKRITSKIKKFIKAHVRHTRAQEDLRRTQAQLQRLGDQLSLDASKPGTIEEDSSIDIVSDGDANDGNRLSPKNELQNHSSPSKKRMRAKWATSDDAKPVNSRKREGFSKGIARPEKLLRSEGLISLSENNSKEPELANTTYLGNSGHRPVANDDKPDRAKNGPPPISAPSEKIKTLNSGHLPSTSMAAHAVDDLIESIEVGEKSEAVDITTASVHGSTTEKAGIGHYLPPPPPPPPPPPIVPPNAYNQYEGDDEDVDVEEVDVQVGNGDPDSEIEIEQ